MFITHSNVIFTIVKNETDFPALITEFLKVNSIFLKWDKIQVMSEEEVLDKLISFCPKGERVTDASEILLS
jgi:hypothetical protein